MKFSIPWKFLHRGRRKPGQVYVETTATDHGVQKDESSTESVKNASKAVFKKTHIRFKLKATLANKLSSVLKSKSKPVPRESSLSKKGKHTENNPLKIGFKLSNIVKSKFGWKAPTAEIEAPADRSKDGTDDRSKEVEHKAESEELQVFKQRKPSVFGTLTNLTRRISNARTGDFVKRKRSRLLSSFGTLSNPLKDTLSAMVENTRPKVRERKKSILSWLTAKKETEMKKPINLSHLARRATASYHTMLEHNALSLSGQPNPLPKNRSKRTNSFFSGSTKNIMNKVSKLARPSEFMKKFPTSIMSNKNAKAKKERQLMYRNEMEMRAYDRQMSELLQMRHEEWRSRKRWTFEAACARLHEDSPNYFLKIYEFLNHFPRPISKFSSCSQWHYRFCMGIYRQARFMEHLWNQCLRTTAIVTTLSSYFLPQEQFQLLSRINWRWVLAQRDFLQTQRFEFRSYGHVLECFTATANYGNMIVARKAISTPKTFVLNQLNTREMNLFSHLLAKSSANAPHLKYFLNVAQFEWHQCSIEALASCLKPYAHSLQDLTFHHCAFPIEQLQHFQTLVELFQSLEFPNFRSFRFYHIHAPDMAWQSCFSTLLCHFHISSQLAHLELVHVQVDFMVLAEGLIACDQLEVFHAEANLVSASSAAAFASTLSKVKWKKCHTFIFRLNCIADEVALTCICRELIQSQMIRSIQTLRLDGNRIGRDTLYVLNDQFERMSRLQVLTLRHCGLGSLEMETLGACLSRQNIRASIRQLDLSSNQDIGASGIQHLVGIFQLGFPVLECLNLSDLNLESLGFYYLSRIFPASASVSSSVSFISSQEDYFPKLRHFYCGNNEAQLEGLIRFKSFFHCPTFLHLQTLDFQSNGWGYETLVEFMQELQHHVCLLDLRVLNLQDNGHRQEFTTMLPFLELIWNRICPSLHAFYIGAYADGDAAAKFVSKHRFKYGKDWRPSATKSARGIVGYDQKHALAERLLKEKLARADARYQDRFESKQQQIYNTLHHNVKSWDDKIQQAFEGKNLDKLVARGQNATTGSKTLTKQQLAITHRVSKDLLHLKHQYELRNVSTSSTTNVDELDGDGLLQQEQDEELLRHRQAEERLQLFISQYSSTSKKNVE